MNMVGTDWIRGSNPRENQNVVLQRKHMNIGVAHNNKHVYIHKHHGQNLDSTSTSTTFTLSMCISEIFQAFNKYRISMNVEEQCEKVDDAVSSQWSVHDRLEHSIMMNLRHSETFQANADLLDRSQHSNTTNIRELNLALSANIGFEDRVQKSEQELHRVKNELMQLRRMVNVEKVDGQQQVVFSIEGQQKLVAAIRDSRRFHMSLPTGGWGSQTSGRNRDLLDLEQALQTEFASLVFTADDFSRATQL